MNANGNFPAQQKTASWKMASKGKALTPDRTYRQGGGETVAAWDCEDGCPVAALDVQTVGLSRPNRVLGTKTEAGQKGLIYNHGFGDQLAATHNDTGGASRFFKQVGGKIDEAD